MNAIGRLNDDNLVQYYCNQIMDLLQVNIQDYAGSSMEQIIKCILSVDEFKMSFIRLVNISAMSMSSLRNNEFFKKA